MTDEELNKITNSMKEKLGEESSATIADDLGLLITGNANTVKSLQEKDKEIARLKGVNEKLVLANGSLLKQVPTNNSYLPSGEDEGQQNKTSARDFDMRTVLDEHGRFKH